jgi:hypothetical protein
VPLVEPPESPEESTGVLGLTRSGPSITGCCSCAPLEDGLVVCAVAGAALEQPIRAFTCEKFKVVSAKARSL